MLLFDSNNLYVPFIVIGTIGHLDLVASLKLPPLNSSTG